MDHKPFLWLRLFFGESFARSRGPQTPRSVNAAHACPHVMLYDPAEVCCSREGNQLRRLPSVQREIHNAAAVNHLPDRKAVRLHHGHILMDGDLLSPFANRQRDVELRILIDLQSGAERSQLYAYYQ
jgi:hypothetical protein